jgi:hypothetical protein
MDLLRCKARLSVLWLTMAIGTVASMFLGLLTPGTIEEVIAGEWGGMEFSGGMSVFMAFFFIIPIVVAILSLTLNGSANRWLNFVLGIIWFLWLIVEIIEHATMEGTVYVSAYLMFAAGIVIAAYIVYFAWKLPKSEE